MIFLDSEARHLKQRPFSGLVINVNKNTGAGYSPIISIHCVNVAISKTSITFKSVFFIRCGRSDSSIYVDKWNLTAATIARSFSQRPQAAILQLRTWPRIHVQPRFQWGFRNGVTFLRVVYGITMLKIRRSRDRLIFKLGIPILVRRYLYIVMPPNAWTNNDNEVWSYKKHIKNKFCWKKCVLVIK